MKPAWYFRRLLRMSPGEIAGRLADEARKRSWRRLQGSLEEQLSTPQLVDSPSFEDVLQSNGHRVPAEAARRLLAAADDVLVGTWPIFAKSWDTLEMDWFRDPRTGRRAPQLEYCFSIDHRNEERVGNVKYVWEPSRHHVATLLAAAYYLTHEDRYADKAIVLLKSWIAQNPFLSGIHWTSAIEVGVRLVSWVWTRRLLHSYPGVREAFEHNDAFLAQARHHQQYLAAFRSRGTSANNHLIVEMTGLFVASCAFPWFPESSRWRTQSQSVLTEELSRQTFPSGLNRELATSYHAFVTEFFVLALLEGEASGHGFSVESWDTLCRSLDAAAAIVDQNCRPPRQGDDDEAFSLLVDDPAFNRWSSLLETGRLLVGGRDWWPQSPEPDVRSVLLASLAVAPNPGFRSRPEQKPYTFPDAGSTILRTSVEDGGLWCRFDHGPHGYLNIAGHAHADALSIELRVDGVPVLVDPGTHSYHGDSKWRSYFRSTFAHNTIEVDGKDQSESGGPFMWTSHAATTTELVTPTKVTASHDGYRRFHSQVDHRRSVSLEPTGNLLIEDRVEGLDQGQQFRVIFHLGPAVDCHLEMNEAALTWPSSTGARLRLPVDLRWTLVRGQNDPPAGWYSAGFDRLEPAYTIIGTGEGPQVGPLVTEFSLMNGSISHTRENSGVGLKRGNK